MSLLGVRRRLPLVVFILLLLVALMLLGFACACLSDHPVQVLERALAAIPAAPPLIEVWSLLTVLLVAGATARPGLIPRRASPAELQRFLF